MFAVVLLSEHSKVYGPFASEALAHRFAAFLTEEVDPAGVFPLCEPTSELLDWREHVHERGDHGLTDLIRDARQAPPPGVTSITPFLPPRGA